jgi:hypothetical protein
MMMMIATKQSHLQCEKNPTQTAQELQDNLSQYSAKKLQPSMECTHSIHSEIPSKNTTKNTTPHLK